ncbi:MAG: PorT family protein [Fibrobacter sp.]|nr:PorT family protein [Fibrobacter sp.]
MNKKFLSVLALVALSSAVFAADPVIPAATPAESVAPAAAAPEATPAPVAETPAEVATPVAATPAAATPEAAIPATEAAEDSSPMVVRDGAVPATEPVAPEVTAPAAEPATVAAPAPAEQEVYRPVYTPTPTAVRQENPVHVVYVAQTPAKDTMSFEELRGFVPMKLSFGVQGFIGSYQLTGDDWDDDDDYGGISWRAGAFALFPLNEYTIGMKVGVLFEQSEASASFDRVYNPATEAYTHLKATFKQRKVDIPVLFTFKGARSSVMFDLGVQAAVPVQDEFKVTYDDERFKYDMIDKEIRNSIDWNLIFGLSIKANRFVAFDLRFDFGFSDLYDTMVDWSVDDLTSSAFLLGMSFYLF